MANFQVPTLWNLRCCARLAGRQGPGQSARHFFSPMGLMGRAEPILSQSRPTPPHDTPFSRFCFDRNRSFVKTTSVAQASWY